MKILVISDIHVGLKTSKKDVFVKYFANRLSSYDEIILNGDIVQGNYPEVFSDGVDFFKLLSSYKGSIRYILGNHDDDDGGKQLSFEDFKSKILNKLFTRPIIVHQNVYEKQIGNNKFVFCHGHTFGSGDTTFSVMAARVFSYTQKVLGSKFNFLFNAIDKAERCISNAKNKVLKGAEDYYNSSIYSSSSKTKHYIMVCGHSHELDSYTSNTFNYFNDGQWLRDTVTFIEIELVDDFNLVIKLNKLNISNLNVKEQIFTYTLNME